MTVHDSEKDPESDYTKDVFKLLNVTSNGTEIESSLNSSGLTKNDLNKMVDTIQEWYEKQQHLPKGALHDQVIIRRLFSQSFSIERVKEKIDNYYTIRRKMPEVLCNRDPLSPTVHKCLKEGYWVVLPKKTPDNKRVTIYRSKSTADFSVTEVIKVIFMIGDYRIRCDAMDSDHWVFDFKYNTLQHATQIHPMMIVKIMFYLNYCLGPKVSGMHLVNLPSFAMHILALFKKSMKAKMVQRLYTYEKFEDLFEFIPRSIFPKEYGGDEVSCQEISDKWMKTFQSSPWREYFIEQDSLYADESKRMSTTKADEIFGVAGSFRQLDFD